MDAGLKRQIVATLKAILDTTNNLQTGTWLRYSRDFGNLRITSDASHQLSEVVDKLTDRWGDKLSREYIHSSLTDILGKMRRDGADRCDSLLDDLVERYQKWATAHLVMIPIAGVDLRIGSLEIGNVEFRQCDAACLEELKSRIHAIMGRNAAVQANAEIRDIWYDHFDKYLVGLKDGVVALFEMVGEEQKATEQAIYETSRSVDVLKYLLPCVANRRSFSVGIRGECNDTGGSILVVDLESGHSIQHGAEGPLKWEIEAKHVDVMAAIGIPALSEMLKKTKCTELEEAILQSLHWYGMAQDQVDEKNTLLCLITCFETFFTRDDRDRTITQTLAEAIALMFSDGLEKRKNVLKAVKDVYTLRGKFSHGRKGKKKQSHLDEEVSGYVYEFTVLAHQLLQKMIWLCQRFTEVGQVHAWLDDVKLQGHLWQCDDGPML